MIIQILTNKITKIMGIIKNFFGAMLQGLGLLVSMPGMLFLALGMWLTDLGDGWRIS